MTDGTMYQFRGERVEGALIGIAGGKGQCWEYAVAESFFATVKTELIHRRTRPTCNPATSALFDYIEGWYNTHRRHSTLGYLSPTQYESSITVTTEQIA